jgi:CBS domain-containing protein
MTVRDVMTRKVLTIAADETIASAGDAMEKGAVHQLVVRGKRGRIVGVIGRGDLAGAPRTARIGDFMPRRLVSVHPDTPVAHAAALMRAYAIGSLPVMNGTRLAGIVTVSDILRVVEDDGTLPDRMAAVHRRAVS